LDHRLSHGGKIRRYRSNPPLKDGNRLIFPAAAVQIWQLGGEALFSSAPSGKRQISAAGDDKKSRS